MNMYTEITGKQHYNRLPVRVQQGKTRARKGDYRPRGIRARDHMKDDRTSITEKATNVLDALKATQGSGLL